MNWITGFHAVEEALAAGRPLDRILVAKGRHGERVEEVVRLAKSRGVPVRFEDRGQVDRATGTREHQGVAALAAAKPAVELEDLLAAKGDGGLLVLLDGIEDPHNLGAIVRTSLAAGAQGVVIPERRAAGLSPAVARSAAGALEHTKVARVPNLVRALMDLKEQGVWVYGFEAAASKSYTELDYSAGCALVLGGEGRGLHRLVREACDQLAHIPLRGPISSLNVSVAAGVVLYEVVRQRSLRLDKPVVPDHSQRSG